ncbi:MAG: outer membrane protein transport protein [Chlamydiales bacterium]|nr:outer membrane protein transport protein [Chlamydiia bacterium]MCP5508401.1 outer membrane protein transport protein [Chlamydiales bacterium]
MKTKNLKSLVLAGVAALCLQASPADALLSSVKSTGMAAAVTAYPLDAFAGVYNPANMVLICDRFDVGAFWVHDTQRMKISGNAVINETRDASARSSETYLAEFAFNKRFCCKYEMSMGLMVYNRNQLKTTYSPAIPLLGTTDTGLEFVHETIAPVWAIKICDAHHFGIALNVNIQRIKVNGLQNFANSVFSIDPANTTNRGYDYNSGVGVTLGYTWQPMPCLRAGITWTPEGHMSKFNKYRGFIAEEGAFNTPQRVQGGIAYQAMPCLAVAFDVEWIEWRNIAMLRNPLEPNLDNIFTDLSDQSLKLGSANGPGFGFKNQWFFRLGVNYEYSDCVTLRAGFRHADTPVTPVNAAVNLLTMDVMQDVLTFGGTWKPDQCNEISIVYALGFLHEVKGEDSVPARLGGGEVDLKQKRCALGLAWGRYF